MSHLYHGKLLNNQRVKFQFQLTWLIWKSGYQFLVINTRKKGDLIDNDNWVVYFKQSWDIKHTFADAALNFSR